MEFKYSNNYKKYHSLDYHYKTKFGQKIFKVSLDGGFTCPNIDGTKGFGGCTYCSREGSGEFAGRREDSLLEQFENIKNNIHKKWKVGKYIGYFQSFTNTYAPLKELKEKFEKIVGLKDVVGLSISTRPDCIEDDVLDYLEELSKRTFLTVELGLQTIYDKTGEYINRKHSYKDFLDGYKRVKERNINIVVHIINGLPFEDKNMMIETAKKVGELEPYGIKIHLLYVVEGTVLEHQFNQGIFKSLELEEYVDIVVDQLEYIPKQVVIHRLTGDGKKENLISPLWSLKKFVVINEIDKEFNRRESFQGKYYKKKLID
ncbi:MAG: TIGR01212 family radical SAM protein [Oscillospiraceae bacterium]|nr:TIGR01212 family radical SAM protein [Oscillospiraceae bacterium]